MHKRITPASVYGTVKAPSSKSYAQRAIAAALLAHGESRLLDMEFCSDTYNAMKIAESLGAQIARVGDGVYSIIGGLQPRVSTIDAGESGLAARMFTPIASLWHEPITITGHGSLLRRPMGMMVGPLRDLGVRVEASDDRLPITVCGTIKGGMAHVDCSLSSQFVTGLLMALSLAEDDTTFTVDNPVSIPYIEMTLDVLRDFGIDVKHNDYREFFVEGRQSYTPRDYGIEGDWSGASCMLVAGAVAGEVTVSNLNPLSKQADIALIHALSRAGAEVVTSGDNITVCKPEQLQSFEFDASDCPDLFPALAVLAANCMGDSVITGTDRLAAKESNRAETIRSELGKMGITVDLSADNTMRITGGDLHGAEVSSHGDHRIAMAMAIAGLCAEGDTTIENAESVDKSYPAFWQDLAAITHN
jgi:3-phosphoshikimate 1-carboxyvinyltransferase